VLWPVAGAGVSWLQKAAMQNEAGAQFILAGMYDAGEHFNQDPERAMELYVLARCHPHTTLLM